MLEILACISQIGTFASETYFSQGEKNDLKLHPKFS
jgi:hypothetical protein